MASKPTPPGQLSPAMMRIVKRGAKIGAIAGGVLGFILGISICMIYRLAIPPLGFSEFGIIIGCCVGVVIAMAGANRVGRLSMNGFFGGSVVGVPVAFCPGHFSPLIWGSITLVSTFLAYQYSQVPVSSEAEPWKLNRA